MAIRRGPSDRELERYIERGLTYHEMVDEHVRIHGEERRVSRNAIASAISRAGLSEEAVRYDRTIPWSPVHNEHSNSYIIQMLRALGRRIAGMPPLSVDRKLDAFLRGLAETNSVVAYAPDTEDGFWLLDPSDVPAEWLDPELPIVVEAITYRAIADHAMQQVDNFPVTREDRQRRSA